MPGNCSTVMKDHFVCERYLKGFVIFTASNFWARDLYAGIITRNEVTFLYVLLECFKWISTYFKANNAINPYNIDLL